MTSILFAKLDPGFFENRKVVKAGRDGRDVFLLALCMNAARGAIGWLPAADLDAEYIAYRLRITEDEARSGIERALAAELLFRDGDTIRLAGWAPEWARTGGKTDAERAKAYRDRKRHGRRDGENDADCGPSVHADTRETASLDGSANCAPDKAGQDERHDSSQPSRDASRESHASRDQREKKEERESDRDAPSPDLPLPQDWKPDAEARRLAAELGRDVEREAADLRDYAAAKGWKRKDWHAAFRRWLRTSHAKLDVQAKVQTETEKRRTRNSMGDVVEADFMPDGEVRRAKP